ncbi:hypothetical protein Tco_1020574, partial [Tanacetum coccineum]
VDLQRSTREDGRRDLLDFGNCCSGNDCRAVTRSERRYWFVGKNFVDEEQSGDGGRPII